MANKGPEQPEMFPLPERGDLDAWAERVAASGRPRQEREPSDAAIDQGWGYAEVPEIPAVNTSGPIAVEGAKPEIPAEIRRMTSEFHKKRMEDRFERFLALQRERYGPK